MTNRVIHQLINELQHSNEDAPAAVIAPLTVETIDNHVYFYCGVDGDRCLALLRTIREVDAKLRNERVSRSLASANIPPTPIWLHIYSGGGDLFAGLACADQLQRFETPIYSVIEGMCGSAATLISMACSRRYILPNSFMLVHQLSSVMWGTHEQFKDEMKLQEMAMARIVSFYAQRTDVSEMEIREVLKHDMWMSSSEALQAGFVDEILA